MTWLRSQSPDAAVPKAEREDGWIAAKWLRGLQRDSILEYVASALSSESGGQSEFEWFQYLADHPDEVQRRLAMRGVAGLSESISKNLTLLKGQTFATGKSMNRKFVQDSDESFAYGSRADYDGGLNNLIGMPDDVRPLSAMYREHCRYGHPQEKFTSDNYGIETSPQEEWWGVCGQWTEESASTEWDSADFVLKEGFTLPSETKNIADAEKRQMVCLKDLFSESHPAHSVIRKAGLSVEEVVAIRLWSGPMYVKYADVLREGKRETFTTTLHALCSGIFKIARIGRPERVFRGLHGRAIRDLHHKQCFVERGAQSFTRDINVARSYASMAGKGAASYILQVQEGEVDKGADIAPLSFYPHEEEKLYGPLSLMQLTGDEVDGHVLKLKMRVNVNSKAGTLEEVMGRRKTAMLNHLDILIRETEYAPVVRTVKDKCKMHELIKLRSDMEARASTEFNDMERLSGFMQEALQTMAGVWNHSKMQHLKGSLLAPWKLRSSHTSNCDELKAKEATVRSLRIQSQLARATQSLHTWRYFVCCCRLLKLLLGCGLYLAVAVNQVLKLLLGVAATAAELGSLSWLLDRGRCSLSSLGRRWVYSLSMAMTDANKLSRKAAVVLLHLGSFPMLVALALVLCWVRVCGGGGALLRRARHQVGKYIRGLWKRRRGDADGDDLLGALLELANRDRDYRALQAAAAELRLEQRTMGELAEEEGESNAGRVDQKEVQDKIEATEGQLKVLRQSRPRIADLVESAFDEVLDRMSCAELANDLAFRRLEHALCWIVSNCTTMPLESKDTRPVLTPASIEAMAAWGGMTELQVDFCDTDREQESLMRVLQLLMLATAADHEILRSEQYSLWEARVLAHLSVAPRCLDNISLEQLGCNDISTLVLTSVSQNQAAFLARFVWAHSPRQVKVEMPQCSVVVVLQSQAATRACGRWGVPPSDGASVKPCNLEVLAVDHAHAAADKDSQTLLLNDLPVDMLRLLAEAVEIYYPGQPPPKASCVHVSLAGNVRLTPGGAADGGREAMQLLGRVLSKLLPRVRDLDLGSCGLNHKAYGAIAAWLPVLPHLKYLNMLGNPAGSTAKRLLRAAWNDSGKRQRFVVTSNGFREGLVMTVMAKLKGRARGMCCCVPGEVERESEGGPRLSWVQMSARSSRLLTATSSLGSFITRGSVRPPRVESVSSLQGCAHWDALLDRIPEVPVAAGDGVAADGTDDEAPAAADSDAAPPPAPQQPKRARGRSSLGSGGALAVTLADTQNGAGDVDLERACVDESSGFDDGSGYEYCC